MTSFADRLRLLLDRTGVTLTLMLANQAFSPLTFSGPELERVRIEGRAIGYLHLYR